MLKTVYIYIYILARITPRDDRRTREELRVHLLPLVEDVIDFVRNHHDRLLLIELLYNNVSVTTTRRECEALINCCEQIFSNGLEDIPNIFGYGVPFDRWAFH